MLYEQNLEKSEQRERARQILEEYKRIEKGIKFHKMKLNSNTVVYCKNQDQLERYILKQKKGLVCRA